MNMKVSVLRCEDERKPFYLLKCFLILIELK